MSITRVRSVSKDEESSYIKPQRIPKRDGGVRNKKKKYMFDGKADEGLKPQHRPYVRCPTNLANYLSDDDDV